MVYCFGTLLDEAGGIDGVEGVEVDGGVEGIAVAMDDDAADHQLFNFASPSFLISLATAAPCTRNCSARARPAALTSATNFFASDLVYYSYDT
jgi:hypothetical protein